MLHAFQDIELAVLHKCQYVIFAGVSKCVIKSLLNYTLYPLGSSLLFSLKLVGISFSFLGMLIFCLTMWLARLPSAIEMGLLQLKWIYLHLLSSFVGGCP